MWGRRAVGSNREEGELQRAAPKREEGYYNWRLREQVDLQPFLPMGNSTTCTAVASKRASGGRLEHTWFAYMAVYSKIPRNEHFMA